MKRKTITARMARDVLVEQAQVYCHLCSLMIWPGEETIWEHLWALARGGPDDETNIRLVHKECADKKTRGTGSTTSGSDIGEIAKTKRLAKARHAKEHGVPKKFKKKIQGRKTIPSRPFPKKVKR